MAAVERSAAMPTPSEFTPMERHHASRLAALDQLHRSLDVSSDLVIALHDHARSMGASPDAQAWREEADRLADARKSCRQVVFDEFAEARDLLRSHRTLEALINCACEHLGIADAR